MMIVKMWRAADLRTAGVERRGEKKLLGNRTVFARVIWLLKFVTYSCVSYSSVVTRVAL